MRLNTMNITAAKICNMLLANSIRPVFRNPFFKNFLVNLHLDNLPVLCPKLWDQQKMPY